MLCINKMEIDVVIIVEHLNRELESALLLERALGERHITSKIVFKGWNEGPASCFIKPKVIVTPWCYDNKDVEALCCYRGGFPDGTFDIVDLHSEQVTTPDGLSFVLPTDKAKRTFHICWGQFFGDALASVGVDARRTCVAGSNRLDFFRDEYRNLSLRKEQLGIEFGIDPAKPWVLFIGNFSTAFFTDERVAELDARGLFNTAENRETSKRAYNETLSWMVDALRDPALKDVEFIYRPHPSEPLSERLQTIEGEFSNLHVIKQHAIRDWFLNCDIGLTWCSTSSVEAAYAGLPVFALRPFEIPAHLQFKLLETIEQIDSSLGLRNTIARVLCGDSSHINVEFVKNISLYYKRGTSSATVEIANAIDKIISDNSGRFSCERPPFYCIRKVLGFAVKQAAFYSGLMQKVSSWRILADDHITQKQLTRKREFING